MLWLQEESRYAMWDGFGIGSLGGHLSQLKKLYKESLFTKSGVYSCLAFFSFGMLGVMPILPQGKESISALSAHIDTRSVSGRLASVSGRQGESVDTGEKAVGHPTERCYWQEDVAQFLTLQENKKGAVQTDVPCEAQPLDKISDVGKKQSVSLSDLGTTISDLTDGYPLQAMAPMIAGYDRSVAALIVGIAKKESDWGKHVPLDRQGADCFNYWGYKGAGSRGIAMGHGCFGSREEAVTAVGNRLQELVAIRRTSAPAGMVIWKCGSSCNNHSDASVKKWISDVSFYYDRIAAVHPVTFTHE